MIGDGAGPGPGPEELNAVRDEATAALDAWDLEPGQWNVVGVLRGGLCSELRPVVEIERERFLLRREPPDLDEDDVRFRHAFMRHLWAEGLPVPYLRTRPGGSSYALVAGDIYELQEWRGGAGYQVHSEDACRHIEAAAATLGALHQASAQFPASPYRWPQVRQPAALDEAYIDIVRRASERDDVSPAVASAAARVAEGSMQRAAQAAQAMDIVPGPPELHIHGDYQPHNLAFGPTGVVAIYDFDAARWSRRLDELAYALICFSGVRDEEGSAPAPLADDGLDILRAHTFLQAYGRVAPPAEDEAELLGDAIALAFPVVLTNGIIEDLAFADEFGGPPTEEDVLPRLEWADAFWLWLDRYRDTLAQAWASATV